MKCDKVECHFYNNEECDSKVNQIMKVKGMTYCPSYRTYIIAVGQENINAMELRYKKVLEGK